MAMRSNRNPEGWVDTDEGDGLPDEQGDERDCGDYDE